VGYHGAALAWAGGARFYVVLRDALELQKAKQHR
jgi:hypothetical protein